MPKWNVLMIGALCVCREKKNVHLSASKIKEMCVLAGPHIKYKDRGYG